MRCRELWFQSARPIPSLPRMGLDASVTMLPLSLWGRKDSSLAEAELMHPAAILLPAMHGAPVTGSAKGLPVIGLFGFVSAVRSAVKSPARCAAVGTNDCTDCAC